MKITYKFLLRGTIDKSIASLVYMQITADRKTTKRAIGYVLSDKEWDFKKGEAKQTVPV